MPLEASARLWAPVVHRFSEISVDIEYLTEIMRSRDGSEQRRAWRDRPRKSIRFSCVAKDDCARTIERELLAHQGGPWAAPDPTREVLSANGMAGAGTQIDLPSAQVWAVVGEAVILRDGARVELRTISAVSGVTLTFSETNSATAWPTGTRIMPALPARLSGRLQAQRAQPGYIDLNVAFDVVPGLEVYPALPSAPTTFNGREAFVTIPRTIEGIEVGFETGLETIDFDAGRVAHYQPIDFNTRTMAATYTPCSAAAAKLIQDVFMRARGRRGEFYAPSWAEDFRQIGSENAGSTSLTIAGDIDTDFGSSTILTAIAVQMSDNTILTRLITNMALSSGNTVLTVNSAWGQTISASTVKRIMWLPVCRFSSDRLTLSVRNEARRLRVGIQTLEDLA